MKTLIKEPIKTLPKSSTGITKIISKKRTGWGWIKAAGTKKYLLFILLIAMFALFGCSEYIIEGTIKKFQDAINDEDPEALKEVLSPDSEFYVTGEFSTFISDNFSDKIPIEYKNLDIDINDNYADVYADEYYNINEPTPLKDDALFVMKKVNNFFSFIFPDWKIYKFYNEGDFENPVWKKIKKK